MSEMINGREVETRDKCDDCKCPLPAFKQLVGGTLSKSSYLCPACEKKRSEARRSNE